MESEVILKSKKSGVPCCPLSYGQEALWFLYEMAPQSVAYNIFTTVKICSNLDLPALHSAWQKIVNRHPILRTTYTSYSGKPVQKINEQQEIAIKETDASNWSEDYLKEKILSETDRPFNLEKDSVLRINLYTRTVQEHVLLLTMHHIAGDMWSFDLLLNEFQVLYAVETKQASFQQIEVAKDFLTKNLSYQEFVSWQSSMLSSSKGEELWKYWQKQLAGEIPVLNLLTDRPRPPVQTYRGETHIFKLDEKLIQELKNLALTSGTSLYRILLAAFFVLLYRYTNTEDILVGSPMLGRRGRKFKAIVGYFVNSVVLRASVSGNRTFKDFLAYISSQVKESQEHQDYPFPLLVEQLQPQRNPSFSPLFQVGFTWQKQRWCHPTKNSSHNLGKELHVEPYPLGHQRGTGFDLDVMVMEVGELIQVCWQYNTDLFNVDTIARMARHFQTLLSAIVANPEQRISSLPLLSNLEQHQLLAEWNNTCAEYPQDKSIHQLFEAQVEQNPEEIAVVFENQQLTYRELNCRANQLAHYLQSLGVKPEVLVGICVERSLFMVVGILGILKAGGAYVPLDPNYPSERLGYILSDSGVSVLLTQQKLVEKLPVNQAQVVCLDAQWELIALFRSENIVCDSNANNLAYVIYTSGSTGKPKGVAIQHRSLVNYTTAISVEYEMSERDRVLQFASISFDASAEEIYTSLTSGATLVLRTDSMLDSINVFLQKCKDWGITVLALPTAYWHELTTILSQQTCVLPPSLRLVIIGGEKALPERLKTWLEYVGQQVRLVNNYGPTEATVGATICELSTTDTRRELPIGRPISNVQTYILDLYQQPVPIGIPGELYIGGDGLARGYLNRPDLTAEKFIPNPFSNKPESRLYKTGDLVRYLPDGNIEFLGRIDNQVKIRGFRIELGEIESVLAQHSAVKETVVIARENIKNSKELIAYIVPHKELAPTIDNLRGFLKEKLPFYMIPSAFVILDALPLTPNGKVDHRALPEPELQLELELTFVLPRTPVEEILANIWAEVLVLKEVGIYNNFFELGGHSLLAVQIISQICEKFEIDLPLSCMFQSPTIAALSQLIDSTLSNNTQGYSSGKIPAVSPQERSQILPLSFAQDYIWCLEHKLAGKYAANSSMALRLTGMLSRTVLERSLNEIIRRHEILRTAFPIVEEQPTQKIAPSFTLPFQFIDLQYLCSQMSKETEAHRIFREAMNHEFDLTVAPPIKTILIQLSEEEHWLLIVMHHIITDGWSYGILLQELETLYSNFLLGKPSVLPELPLQYADFAIWQRKYFSEEVLSAHLPYWQKHLANFPTSLDLFPVIQSTSDKSLANEYNFSLPISLTSNIASLSHACSVTPFIVLLTALNILLHKWSKQTDILVVGTIANRSTPEIERLLGCFISDLPLGIQFNCNQTAISLLEHVRKTVAEGLAYTIPSEKIWEPVDNKLKILRTLTFVLVPATNWLGQAFKCEELTISSDRGLWDEQDIPLELYAYYPNETIQAIKFHACYSKTTFTAEMIERFLKSYQAIIEQLVRYPETIISDFVLIE